MHIVKYVYYILVILLIFGAASYEFSSLLNNQFIHCFFIAAGLLSYFSLVHRQIFQQKYFLIFTNFYALFVHSFLLIFIFLKIIFFPLIFQNVFEEKEIMLFRIIISFILYFISLYKYFFEKIGSTTYEFKTPIKITKSLKIVCFSDLHLNALVSYKDLKKIVFKINNEDPDIILCLGDLFSTPISLIPQKKFQLLSLLKAKLGIYFISGNDDLTYDFKELKELLKNKLAWQVLGQDKKVHHIKEYPITLIGEEDPLYYTKNKIKREIIELDAVHSERLNIFLSHRPNIEMLMKNKEINFQLSGHTHGGHCWPLTWISYFKERYVYGLYKINHRQNLIISAGCGYSNPGLARLGSKREIVILNFKECVT